MQPNSLTPSPTDEDAGKDVADNEIEVGEVTDVDEQNEETAQVGFNSFPASKYEGLRKSQPAMDGDFQGTNGRKSFMEMNGTQPCEKDGTLRPEYGEDNAPLLLVFSEDEESREKFQTDSSSSSADDGIQGSVEKFTRYPNEKGDTESSPLMAPQKLGFEPSSFNGGRQAEPFNLDEFLRLAHAVINNGDEKTVVALWNLKIDLKGGGAPPRLGGLRPPVRCLLTPRINSGSSKNAGTKTQTPATCSSDFYAGTDADLCAPETSSSAMAVPAKDNRRCSDLTTVGFLQHADVAIRSDVAGKLATHVAEQLTADRDVDVMDEAGMTYTADIIDDAGADVRDDAGMTYADDITADAGMTTSTAKSHG
ncbi:UNVERIFIED_CONTAM: hypothetical protein Sindi_0948100 [Sesamum indicum]